MVNDLINRNLIMRHVGIQSSVFSLEDSLEERRILNQFQLSVCLEHCQFYVLYSVHQSSARDKHRAEKFGWKQSLKCVDLNF